MSPAGESHHRPRLSQELHPRPAPVVGVAGVVGHEDGDLGVEDGHVRGAAQGTDLQQPASVGLNVLLAVSTCNVTGCGDR